MIPLSRVRSILLAAGGGWITTLAFPDVGAWPLAFIGVAALVLACGRDSARFAALCGLTWAVVFFAIHLYWAKIATASVPWIALIFLQAPFVAAACAAYVWARRIPRFGTHRAVAVAAFTACFVAGEQARAIMPFGGFPWGRLAFSQAASPLGRSAILAGEILVSVLVCAVGATIAMMVTRQWGRVVAVGASVCALAMAGPAAIRLDNTAQAGTLRVGAVQGNVSEPGLGSFANRGEVLTNHVEGTLALAEREGSGTLDVVLWPENGSDLDPQQAADVARDIDKAATAAGAPLLVGAQEYPDSGGRYNVLLLWQPGGGVADRYAKQHPAPFGEYIPLRSALRVFSDQVDRVSIDMIPGRGVGLIDLPSQRLQRDVPLGTLICFEVAYEPLVYDSVRAGAQMLVIPTNNASFGTSAESTQQLAMSRLRAIETGRATVQISTVGVSGIIAPDGRLIASTRLFTADQLAAELPLRTSTTPAVALGAAPAWTVTGIAVAMVAAGVVSRIRLRNRT